MLTLPLPLPDEFCLGHLHRTLAVNGLKTFRGLLEVMKIRPKAYLKSPKVALFSHEILAHKAGLIPHIYRIQHSFLRIRWINHQAGESMPFPFPHVEVSDDDLGVYERLHISSASREIEMPWRLCQACREQDTAQHGHAYWHRKHQVSGVHFCPTHDLPLMAFSPDAIKDFPAPDTIVGTPPSDIETQAGQTETLKIYRWLIGKVLEKDWDCSSHIRYQHESQAIRTHIFRRMPAVAKYDSGDSSLTEALPREWIKQVFGDDCFVADEGNTASILKEFDAQWPDGHHLLKLSALAAHAMPAEELIAMPPAERPFFKRL